MYTIIESSLKRIREVKAGNLDYEDLLSYERVVYQYRAEAITLLKGRVNMLMALALAKVSPIKED